MVRKRRRPKKIQQETNYEVLEPRQLLAIDIANMASMIDGYRDDLQGVTIVTHGFQFFESDGDSMLELAQEIRNRADSENGSANSAWLLDYDVPTETTTGYFDDDLTAGDDGLQNGSILTGIPSELVLLFDWAGESNEISSGWGEAAGDALFTMLVGLDLVRPSNPLNSLPLHFIGHSFGSAVTSEAVERLAYFDIVVDQVTYLDPHDFDQSGIPVDQDQRLFELGKPDGYGAVAWGNVEFVDVYYQTRTIPAIPEGRPIPGAYNTLLNDDPRISGLSVFNPHSAVWNSVYMDSVTDASSTTGFGLSRIAAGEDLRPATDFNFYNSQDHDHTPGAYQPGTIAADARESFSATRQTPAQNFSTSIYNGDFVHAGDEFDAWAFLAGQNLIPGWSYHEGGGSGRVVEQSGNYFLQLDGTGPSRTHNAFYLDSQAGILEFDLEVATAGFGEQLAITIGETTIAGIDLDVGTGFLTQQVVVPRELRGRRRQ